MQEHGPSYYLLLRNGGDGPSGCSLHSRHYDFNDELLSAGAELWVHLVRHQLDGDQPASSAAA